jgi:hypothetical protein
MGPRTDRRSRCSTRYAARQLLGRPRPREARRQTGEGWARVIAAPVWSALATALVAGRLVATALVAGRLVATALVAARRRPQPADDVPAPATPLRGAHEPPSLAAVSVPGLPSPPPVGHSGLPRPGGAPQVDTRRQQPVALDVVIDLLIIMVVASLALWRLWPCACGGGIDGQACRAAGAHSSVEARPPPRVLYLKWYAYAYKYKLQFLYGPKTRLLTAVLWALGSHYAPLGGFSENI